MEDVKKGARSPQAKLSYEELQQKFGDLFTQYQKATSYIAKLEAAMDEHQFAHMNFFVNMLFKVMDHHEMYTQDFVKWSAANIEQILTGFAESMAEQSVSDNNVETKEEGIQDRGKYSR